MTIHTEPTKLEVILSYARLGLRVVPIPAGQKHPGLAAWQDVATTDETLIVEWWRRWPDHGVGIVCGIISGIFVLDVDISDGKGGDDTLADLEATYGALPDTWTVITGTGGCHYYFHMPPGLAIANDAGKRLGPGLDIRGEGGQVLAPGSVHPNGREYLWDLARNPYNIPLADPPDWLVTLLTQPTVGDGPARRKAERNGSQLPGDVFAAEHDWPELLTAAGAAYCRTMSCPDGTSYELWARPGVDHPSASLYYRGSDVLKVFTSNWPGLDPEATYTRFGFYAALNHGGDHSAAAAELGEGQRHAAVGRWEAEIGSEGAQRRSGGRKPGGATTNGNNADGRAVSLTAASSIPPRPVRWLWAGRVPLGALVLLGGREGTGKSTCAYVLAADLTRGTLDGVAHGTPRAVIVAATEDSWAHTIVPRLMAAGADLGRVYRVDVTAETGARCELSLPLDIPALRAHLAAVGAALVLLDPLMSRIDARLDTHKDSEVRQALEPLVALADTADVVVLGIIHVNKSAVTDALSSIMGSRAFTAVSRAVMFAMIDPEDAAIRLLGMAKNSLGRLDLPTLRYRIESAIVAQTDEGPVETGHLVWLEPTDRSIADALEDAGRTSEMRTLAAEAAEWLRDWLAMRGGGDDSATIKREAQRAGHAIGGLHRARQKLNVVVTNDGFPRKTYWNLPTTDYN